MDNGLDLQYDRLLGEGSYGKVFLVRQGDGQQVRIFSNTLLQTKVSNVNKNAGVRRVARTHTKRSTTIKHN